MARAQFKALGADLNDLAKVVSSVPRRSAEAFAYANSGVLALAGKVVGDRYLVEGRHMEGSTYTAPPGATHGPFRLTVRNPDGTFRRDALGRFVPTAVERKIFVKGKFVSRSGGMAGFVKELGAAQPSPAHPAVLAVGSTAQRGKTADALAEITADGDGVLELSGGYRAAEVGTRTRTSSPVRGWWRAIRTVRGRWSTLVGKRYPDLFRLPTR